MADLIGSTLGRFEVTGVLGAGGFATVYRAHDPVLGSEVAIKVLGDNHARNNDVRRRFEQEGQLMRRFASAGPLLQVYDAGTTPDDQPYLVLELARSGTLADRLAEQRTMTEDDLLAIVHNVADALDPLHQAGVVHRDVSPGNIFLDREGVGAGQTAIDGERVLLGDLGLAKDLQRSSGLTAGAGTSEFASPEQIQPFGEVTPAADIYGAGALVRALTEGTPLQAALRPVVEKATATEPEDRHRSIGLFEGAVVEALGRSKSSAPLRRADTRRRNLTVVGVACLVSLAALWWFSRDPTVSVDSVGAPETIIVLDRVIADGWDDFSWGRLDDRADLVDVEVEGFGAVSMRRESSVAIDQNSWLRIVYTGDVDAALSLSLRHDGNAGGPECRLEPRAYTLPGRIEVPVIGLVDEPRVQRINIVDRAGNGFGPMNIERIEIFNGEVAADPVTAYCRQW